MRLMRAGMHGPGHPRRPPLPVSYPPMQPELSSGGPLPAGLSTSPPRVGSSSSTSAAVVNPQPPPYPPQIPLPGLTCQLSLVPDPAAMTSPAPVTQARYFCDAFSVKFPHLQAFVWTIRKNSRPKKTSSKLFKNSIICQLKTEIFAQKNPEVDIFCTKVCPNLSFKA